LRAASGEVKTACVLAQLAAFLAVSVAVICTPGPDTALTVRNALAGGRRTGVWTAAGVALGQSIWTVAAGAGVAGLLRASEPAFLAVKAIGVGYLVLLGAQSLWAALTQRGHAEQLTRSARRLTPARAMRQGLLNDLGNPKMAAFFISLLPQFIPAGRPAFVRFLLLGMVFCLLTFTWLAAYSYAIGMIRELLSRPRVRRSLEAITGCVLVAFGVRLAAERR
jgi:threonine/homoserine/homoserine lactone efflux protein